MTLDDRTGRQTHRKRFSSFKLKITAHVPTDEGETIVADAYTNQGNVVRALRLPLAAFHSRRDLLRFLPSADLQWTGNDE